PSRRCALSLHDALPIYEMLEDPVLDESWEGDVSVGRLGPGEDGESDRSGAGQFGQDALRSRVEQMRVVDEDHLRGAGRGEHRDRSEEHTSELQSRFDLG